MKSEEAALNLSTEKPEHPKVSIDGVSYDLALAEDFKLREFLWLETKGIEIMQALNKGHANLKEVEFENLEALLSEIASKVLIGVPAEVMEGLQDSQRLQIVELFTETVGNNRGRTTRSDGLKSSPDSKDSTADLSTAG